MVDPVPVNKNTVVASQQQLTQVLALRATAKAAGDKKAYKMYDDAYNAIIARNKAVKSQSLSNQIASGQAQIDIDKFLENPSQNVYVDANGKPIDMSKLYTATGGALNTSTLVTPMSEFKNVGDSTDLANYDLVPTSRKGISVLAEKDPTSGSGYKMGPRAIYVDPTDPSKYSIGTVSQVVDKVLSEYRAQPDGIKNLKRLMVANKQLTKAKASNNNDVDEALRLALVKKITVDSAEQWSKYKEEGGATTQFVSFNDRLTGGGSLTTTGVNVATTDPAQARAEAKNFIKGMVGIDLDNKLAIEYSTALNKLESGRADKTITTRDPLTGNTYTKTVRGGVTQEEKAKLLYKTLSKVVKNTPYEVLVKNGGKAIQDAAELTKYAANFGYKITTKDAVNRIVAADAAGSDVRAEMEKIKQATIARYGHLTKAIEAGSTLKDIVQPYLYYKAQLMEVPQESLTLDDPDIQAALDSNGKLMNTNDFQIRIRKNPLWGKTKNAREEAAGYANSILKSFGLSA